MDILKISIFGISAVLLALILKSYRPEYSYYISIAVCICIFLLVATKLELIIGYAEKMQRMLRLDNAYMGMILKMIGVTYIADFASNICKDCGYQTIAGQIELFAKLSILVLGMPVILGFMETIGELL
ncbi:MAG: stage III sporulation protein AD [Eubacterium sp.]|jgi:stage III sporulation protein AD|nr:stage III sporulation protein AD [Eubacterium sp.]NBI86360.1 stage III sporulation protein AD [Lachnospiraceae bacterium]